MRKSISDPRGLGDRVAVQPGALDLLVQLAAGDARRALTALEVAAETAQALDEPVTVAAVEQSLDRAAVRYDRDGDQHYDVTSAFIKSIRGSDVDAALHYLARMIAANQQVGEFDDGALAAILADCKQPALTGMTDAQVAAILADAAEPAPPADFQDVDENLPIEHVCPKCGFQWSGKPS